MLEGKFIKIQHSRRGTGNKVFGGRKLNLGECTILNETLESQTGKAEELGRILEYCARL